MSKTFSDFGIDLPYNASGENVRTQCPVCTPGRKPQNRNAKDLSVNVALGVWKCHHTDCGWSGSLKSDDDWRDAVSRGTPRQTPKPRKVYQLPKRHEVAAPTKPYIDQFAKRGISAEYVTRAGIEIESRKCPECQAIVEALAIPYRRGDDVIHVKYRHTTKDGARHFWSSYETEREMYGLDDLIGQSVGVIVEGEIDKITLDVVGGWASASVPDGAPPVTAKSMGSSFDFLDGRAADILAALDVIVIAVDTDRAGDLLADELSRRLGVERCARVTWPKDCKDANETLVEHGPDIVRQCIEDARPYPVSGIIEVNDLWARVEEIYEYGYDPGRRIGYADLDDKLRWREGLFYVFTGSPSHGKSVFLDDAMARLARSHDWPIAICSPENQPLEDHLSRLTAHVIGKPFKQGRTPRMTLDELRSRKEWFQQHFTFIMPSVISIDEILRLTAIDIYRRGTKMLVIDPWTELEHRRPQNIGEVEFTARELSKLAQFAKQYKILVALVAHPKTMVRDRTTKKYPIPRLYDISGGAAFRNKADVGVCVWRDESDDTKATEIHVQKVRHNNIVGRHGTTGYLTYDAPTERFFDTCGDVLPYGAVSSGDPWDVVLPNSGPVLTPEALMDVSTFTAD